MAGGEQSRREVSRLIWDCNVAGSSPAVLLVHRAREGAATLSDGCLSLLIRTQKASGASFALFRLLRIDVKRTGIAAHDLIGNDDFFHTLQ